MLPGWHLGRWGYALAGPVLALNFRQQQSAAAGQSFEALYQALDGSVRRAQLLGQLGVGVQLWRFDLSARYEHSLTPYSRTLRYQGRGYDYRQHTEQLVFSLGFLLYERQRPWRQ